ncbi:MAG: hypothetical protein HYY02_03315 [Chloroflexi bacterium]|nr:hypothetical protein [Chloroflexota bacterium]
MRALPVGSTLRRALTAGVASGLLALALLWQPLYVFACAVAGVQAYQATQPEVALAMERASLSQLGPDYPALPLLEMGYPQATPVAAPVPCVLLKAIGYVEGSWRQAAGGVPEGAAGAVKQSATCGFGIMQITSGMRAAGELPPDVQQRIAADYRFNIGWGAKLLAEKWNGGDYLNAVVGNRDPSVAENWYYAVWAYNQFTFKNNPNNPDYPWPRPAFDGSQSRTSYPYQELVWGYAAHPPLREGKPLWEPVPLGLPKREDVGVAPGPLPPPTVANPAACRTLYAAPGSLSWRMSPGEPPAPQTVALASARGPQPASWKAEAQGAPWLALTPSAGTSLPAQVTLSARAAGLAPGIYGATVVFTSQDGATAAMLLVELQVLGTRKTFIPYLPRRAVVGAQ